MADVLARLFATIEARAGADPSASHTAALLAKGPGKCAEKFGEEAVEAIVAATSGDRAGLTHEAADALYHLQVMLRASGVAWVEVLAELERREGRSGIAEKASRLPATGGDPNARLRAELRTLLTPIAAQYPRPWMTDTRDIAGARVFLVGFNQRNGFPEGAISGMDAYLDALFNVGPEDCRSLYRRIVGEDSPTRRNSDQLAAALAACGIRDVVQTNAICFSAPTGAHLRGHPDGASIGRRIFRTLVERVAPAVLIVHGQGTADELRRSFGWKIPAPANEPTSVPSEKVDGMIIVALPSLAPPEFNKWEKWSTRFGSVARHVAYLLEP